MNEVRWLKENILPFDGLVLTLNKLHSLGMVLAANGESCQGYDFHDVLSMSDNYDPDSDSVYSDLPEDIVVKLSREVAWFEGYISEHFDAINFNELESALGPYFEQRYVDLAIAYYQGLDENSV